jgi:hypothetical protein
MTSTCRKLFVGSLVTATLLVLGLAGLLFWQECLDMLRVGVLSAKLYEMEASPRASTGDSLAHFSFCTDEVQRLVNQLSSVSALEELSRRCLADNWHTRGGNQNSEDWHSWAVVCVFYRLSAINTEQSCRALVDLYFNEDLHFDGEYAECASEALFDCPRNSLPQLRNRIASSSVNGVQRSRLKWMIDKLEREGSNW